MPRIPSIADMGARPVPDGQRPVVSDQSGEITAQATRQLGDSFTHAGNVVYEQQANMARAQATNALLDHEIAVKSKVEDVKKRVESGEISYDKARSVFQTEMGAYQLPQIQHLDPVATESYTRGARRNMLGGNTAVQHIADAAEQIDFKDQFAKNLDNLGKLAGMPDADIEKINGQADMFAPLAQRAGIPKNIIDHSIQNFKDQNWLNQATQRSMEARDSLPALKDLEHQLTAADGYYIGKLDTDKRNAVLSQVIGHRIALENRLAHEGDKRDAKAELAVNQFEQQVSKGVPSTPEMKIDWAQTVKGTPSEPVFKDLLNDEIETQKVLTMPIADQVKFAQDKVAEVTSHGGSLREAANANRLAETVKKNVEQLQTDPLLFQANRLRQDYDPVDINNPEDKAKIDDRMATLLAMRKQYGPQVPIKPLLPQEAAQLRSLVEGTPNAKANPAQQQATFEALQNVMPDSRAYAAAVNQITADPVVRLAGVMQSLNYKFTGHQPTSELLLEGRKLLQDKATLTPVDKSTMQDALIPEYNKLVGNAIPRGDQASESNLAATKAVYAALAQKENKNDGILYTDILRQAVNVVTGGIIDYRGQKVIPPYGMKEVDFNNAVAKQIDTVAPQSSHAPSELRGLPLVRAPDGTYVFQNGRNFVPAKDGSTLKIRL